MKKYVVMACTLIFVAITSIAREKRVNSEGEFQQETRRFPPSVVFFYTSRFDKKTEREYGQQLKEAQRVFDRVAKMGRYENAGVGFFSVDVAKERLVTLKKRYGIKEVPVYMLFFKGKPFKNVENQLVKRTVFLDQDELISLVERHFGKDITGYLKERARLRQREREESSNRWSPYFYWGYGGGYPWGYPYYYYQPGPSFGFSIGI